MTAIDAAAVDPCRDEIEPPSVTGPNVTLTKTETFREALKSAGVTDRDNSQNERQQWRRITISLANKGVLVISGDLCWKA